MQTTDTNLPNAVLSLAMMAISGGGIITWVSPRAIDWLTVRLSARARALTASRIVYAKVRDEVMQSASGNQRPVAEMRSALPAVEKIAASDESDTMDWAHLKGLGV